MNIRNKILAIRTLKGFSQEKMAEELAIEISTYGKTERGTIKLTVERAEQIAKILGVKLTDLFDYSDISGVSIPQKENSEAVIKNLYEEIIFLRKCIEKKDKQIDGILSLKKTKYSKQRNTPN